MERCLSALLCLALLFACPISGVSQEEFSIDYKKMSPIVTEYTEPIVLETALKVIDAFLNYETSVPISLEDDDVLGFLDTLGYVVNLACPPFTAYTDYSPAKSYDRKNREVFWTITLSEGAFYEMLEVFSRTVEAMFEDLKKDDPETLRAMILYLRLIEDAAYDYELFYSDYDSMDPQEYKLLESAYYSIMNKSGICSSYSIALVFLYTQAGLVSGTVSHHGGVVAHMWPFVRLDGRYYYLDPTWDVSDSPRHFGMTSLYREQFAGGYDRNDGRMLRFTVPETFDFTDTRFDEMREKLPVEITSYEIDRETQTLDFYGYEYCYSLPLLP